MRLNTTGGGSVYFFLGGGIGCTTAEGAWDGHQKGFIHLVPVAPVRRLDSGGCAIQRSQTCRGSCSQNRQGAGGVGSGQEEFQAPARPNGGRQGTGRQERSAKSLAVCAQSNAVVSNLHRCPFHDPVWTLCHLRRHRRGKRGMDVLVGSAGVCGRQDGHCSGRSTK